MGSNRGQDRFVMNTVALARIALTSRLALPTIKNDWLERVQEACYRPVEWACGAPATRTSADAAQLSPRTMIDAAH